MIATLIACAKSLMPKPDQPNMLSDRDKLRIWIEIHMPELDRELGPMTLDQVRIRLNAITGCNVQGGDSIEAGSGVFLAALKKMKGPLLTPKPADPAEIARWVEQNMPGNQIEKLEQNEDKS